MAAERRSVLLVDDVFNHGIQQVACNLDICLFFIVAFNDKYLLNSLLNRFSAISALHMVAYFKSYRKDRIKWSLLEIGLNTIMGFLTLTFLYGSTFSSHFLSHGGPIKLCENYFEVVL